MRDGQITLYGRPVWTGATVPLDGDGLEVGDLWYDTMSNELKVCTDDSTVPATFSLLYTAGSHVLATTSGLGSEHTVSGLAEGQFLRATGATTAAFQTIQDSDLGSGTADSSSYLRGDRTWATITAGFNQTIQEESVDLTQRPKINFVGSGITAADNAGTLVTDVTLDADLNAIADLASTGLVARTGSGTASARTLTGTSNEVSVADGDGVSGNPTVSLPATIDLGGKTSLEIPNSTSPTVDAAGEIAIDTDTDGTNVTQGSLTYYDGTQQMYGIAVDAVPSTDGHVLTYNGTSKKYEFKVPTAASAYATVQEEGTPLTTRTVLNFVGSGITAADNAGNTRTDVTLDANLNAIVDLGGNGIIAKTGAGTASNRTITGTSNEVDVADGDGVSGNPTIGISDNPILPGTGAVTVPIGTTAQREGTPTSGDIRYNSTTSLFEVYENGGWVSWSTDRAPANAQFLTLATDGTLASERVFTPGNNLVGTDAGAGSTYTLAADTQAVLWTGIISPTALTGSVNDYNPTNLSTSSVLRLDSDGNYNITGISGGSAGRLLILHNVGANSLTITDEDVLSTAGNRFALNSDTTIAADQSLLIQYDGTSSRWRLIGGTGGAGSSTLAGLSDVTITAANSGDYLRYSGAAWVDVAVTQLESDINHDNLTGFVANEHIDWTSTSSNFATTGTGAFGGDVTIYEATNDGNPQIRLGSGDTEELHIQAVYDGGAQTLDRVRFTTDAASVTADKGQYTFNVDGTDVVNIDDGGVDVVSGFGYSIGGTSVLNASTLGSGVTTSSLTALGTVTTGTWQATDVGVEHGGTGNSSATAYAVICGGTTSTNPLQSIASVGTSGQVLTSNGAGALPTFQTAAGGSKPPLEVYFKASDFEKLETNVPALGIFTGSNIKMMTQAFDATTIEYVNFTMHAPNDLDTSGTVTFHAYCMAATAATANIVLDFDHSAIANSEALDAASPYTTESSGAKAVDTTQDDLTYVTWTETVTNLGWAADDFIRCRLSRNTGVSDTLSGDLYLLGFKVEIPRA